jgi:hypothetical protein
MSCGRSACGVSLSPMMTISEMVGGGAGGRVGGGAGGRLGGGAGGRVGGGAGG